ncbi:thioredoxin-like protein [Fomes fomentarius]|nr:thioredoxin-like protein [Fomes fomentarius]
MSSQPQITLYSSPLSPFGDRVRLALEEAGAIYTLYNIDTRNKPAWYISKVNSAGKIPALTYGGPKTSPEDPSPESAKLAESLAIVEFIAEIFPQTNLLPADPVLRSRARFLGLWLESTVINGYRDVFFLGQSPQIILDHLETLQSFLPEKGFAVGPWSVADIAVGTLLIRIELLLANDTGKYPVGEGKKAFQALQGPRFTRIQKYLQDVRARPSVKAAIDEVRDLNPAMLTCSRRVSCSGRDCRSRQELLWYILATCGPVEGALYA